jgi:hypothetical protein
MFQDLRFGLKLIEVKDASINSYCTGAFDGCGDARYPGSDPAR